LQKADDIVQAMEMGLRETYRFIIKIYQQLQRMATGRISFKMIGGPITIARAAYQYADYGIYQFILFLGLISVNLAVINFLPIPVLDGGHMVFLIYEKLRGRPAPEQVRVAATYVGLLLIVSLMCFVIYRDLTHIF
jgi:regulator of sigma E protease